MASIFKTLEGGHLDRALFSSQVEEGKKHGFLRTNIEAFTVAIVLALTIKQFAFEAFRVHAVDAAVIETGLGGRLDATNVVRPRVCVITALVLSLIGMPINVSFRTGLLAEAMTRVLLSLLGAFVLALGVAVMLCERLGVRGLELESLLQATMSQGPGI